MAVYHGPDFFSVSCIFTPKEVQYVLHCNFQDCEHPIQLLY